MDEKQNQPFQLSFNASAKVDFRSSYVQNRETNAGNLVANQIVDTLPPESPAVFEKTIGSAFAVCSCGACGGRMTANSWGADVCAVCHSIFASTLPSREELDRFYAQFNLTYSGGGRKRGAVDRQKRYAYRYLSRVRRYRERGS